jgi:VWFA-related protein
MGWLLVVGSLSAGLVQAADSDSPGPVIRISVEVIQLDAVVTDKQGQHVTDLGPDDFEVLQDGVSQEISHVTYVRAGEPWVQPRLRADSPAAAAPAVPAPPRTIVLLYDDLGMTLEGAVRARNALTHVVEGLLATDRVAIISSSKWDGVLAFSADREALKATVADLGFSPRGRDDIAFPTFRASSDFYYGLPFNAAELDRNQRIALDSLFVIRRAVEELKPIDGRKAIILVSEGFAELTALEGRYSDGLIWAVDLPFSDRGDVYETLRRLGDYAARASVVVHSLDPRGLGAAGPMVASAQHGYPPGARPFGFHEASRRSINAQAYGAQALRNTQASLAYLPHETGGLAIRDTNDLQGGMERVLTDMSGYYLIGYQPQSGTFEGDRPRFRKIKIGLKSTDLTIRTRRGFYGISDDDI